MPDLLVLAERVVLARLELKAAEDAFHAAALGTPKRGAPTESQVASAAVPTGTVASRVRDLMKDGGRSFEFGEIVQLLDGRSKKMAIRAALKKLRAKGQVQFRGGKYGWKK
jgi:hypothetical protein